MNHPEHMTPWPPFCWLPGVTLTPEGAHFVVYSRNATAVDLCLYDVADPARETLRARMTRGERDLWHVWVPGVQEGQLYGYRAHGLWLPSSAQRFNPNKLLLDPYARAIFGEPTARMSMCGPDGPQSAPGAIDNGAVALKSVVVNPAFDWQDDRPPRIPWQDTVVYELHVKGFTQQHPDLPAELRGTYAGLAHPSVIRYLKDLGVTSLQLLPVHQHLDDEFLIQKGLTNYWGYNTVGFFAPHNEYATGQSPQAPVEEFKRMVQALHAAGLEVILDVVYNHTGEGSEQGPTLLFRGLDDRMYYRHAFGEYGASYIDSTGCGNAVDSASPPALRLILDSLRYWVTEMHVDGFRFDLAVTVGRNELNDFHVQSQFLSAVAQDPVLSQVKLIAEPWDIHRHDSYQIGGFPEPWRELNGKYRDTVRRFWAGDRQVTAEFAKRICGSQDIYGWTQRPALSSVNFITSHDGFTLLDLVSYTSKHNEANGEDNRDGDNVNHSINLGVEGPTTDAQINELRGRLRRSLMATLLTSVGVPFITAGDERGRTQRGNNNAYCQDNEVSWIDWESGDEEMLDCTRRLIALRRSLATFRRSQFFDGKTRLSGLPDVTWLDSNGSLLCHEEWHDPARVSFGALLEAPKPLLLLYNAGVDPRPFLLPGTPDSVWELVFDTTRRHAFAESGTPQRLSGASASQVAAHSVACYRLLKGPALVDPHC